MKTKIFLIFVTLCLLTTGCTKESNEITLTELSNINDQIITYFQSDNVAYNNYSYNYIDPENMVIVVGLLDNSEEAQAQFKNIVIDSEYLRFEKAKELTN